MKSRSDSQKHTLIRSILSHASFRKLCPNHKGSVISPQMKKTSSNSFLWKGMYHTGAVPIPEDSGILLFVSEKQVGWVLLLSWQGALQDPCWGPYIGIKLGPGKRQSIEWLPVLYGGKSWTPNTQLHLAGGQELHGSEDNLCRISKWKGQAPFLPHIDTYSLYHQGGQHPPVCFSWSPGRPVSTRTEAAVLTTLGHHLYTLFNFRSCLNWLLE